MFLAACRFGLVALLLPLALAGCSGTRFGDALSRSFSGAPTPATGGSTPALTPSPGGLQTQTPAVGTAPGKAQPAANATADGKASADGKPQLNGKAPADGKPGSTAPVPPTPASASSSSPVAPVPARPAPYRVTILLPQADASAPAEVVTQALRAAGVPFEVETIERIGSGASLPAAGGSGAASPLAPTVRPAPAPR